MLQRILIHGLIAGLIVGGLMSATTIAMADNPPPMSIGMIIGYTSMLLALTMVFVGIKRHRDLDRGGIIGFWPAFGMGVAISAVAGILYVLAWEMTLAITGMDYGAVAAEIMVKQAREQGADAATLARVAADGEAFRRQYADPLFRLPVTFTEILPVGLIVSLLSAALLRNPGFLPLRRA